MSVGSDFHKISRNEVMDHRSPFENIFGMISGLPQGHDKPVKHALYNAVAILLLFVSCAAAWALFLILEPFVKPLMWALLVGSVLHPLKRSLRDRFQAWFEALEVSHTPVVLGIALLPVNIINDLSNFIGDLLLKRIKVIVTVCVAVPVVLLLYNYTPNFICSLIWKICSVNFYILNFFINISSIPFIIFVLIGYISLVYVMWKPNNNTTFHYASIGIWLLLSFALAHQFGSFQLPIFIILQLIFFGGFVSEVYDIYKTLNSEGNPISLIKTLSIVLHERSSELDVSDEVDVKETPKILPEDSSKTVKFNEEKASGDLKIKKNDPWSLELFEEKPKIESESDLSNTSLLITNQGIHVFKPVPKRELKRSMSQPHFSSQINLLKRRKLSMKNVVKETEKYESTFYLYSISCACLAMLFWKNIILLPFLLVLILFYIVKHTGKYFGLWNYMYQYLSNVFGLLEKWCCERHDALVPVPIRGLYRVIDKINVFVKVKIKESIDTVASCVVIFGLIIFLTCASVFIAFQIYAEAIILAQMTSNVINQTVVHNPELRQLLPPAWDDTVESILDNAYQYGREGISKAIKSVMSDVDTAKSEKLEQQVLELWDRLYQSWMSSDNTHGPKVNRDAVRVTWQNFVSDIQKSPEMFNLNGIMDFAKQNVGTMMSLLESVWVIVKGNISLVLGSFSAFLSVILGGGTAVVNFIINGIVFFTTLFYLLNSSGNLYKPVQLMTNLSSGGSRFGHALEGAVNGVFTASFKMASFYGLWTWFIHNLFGVKIVYLPTAFATIFGAAPFLGTYWACFPAVLDLWLAQSRGIEAILFGLFQFLPTSIVDTTIYAEIKGGGHPYLTGLAIGGGIFCLGLEGAIIGPLLLCGLFVAIDLSSSLFKESPSDETLNLRLQLQER